MYSINCSCIKYRTLTDFSIHLKLLSCSQCAPFILFLWLLAHNMLCFSFFNPSYNRNLLRFSSISFVFNWTQLKSNNVMFACNWLKQVQKEYFLEYKFVYKERDKQTFWCKMLCNGLEQPNKNSLKNFMNLSCFLLCQSKTIISRQFYCCFSLNHIVI